MAGKRSECRKAAPTPSWKNFHRDTSDLPGLVRSADFIGQLADPNRMQKCTALFHEFEVLGLNPKLGYKRPGDLQRQVLLEVGKPLYPGGNEIPEGDP